MNDISLKDMTVRRAVAEGTITLKPQAFKALMANKSPKGNVLETAKIAGIMAAKSTPSLVPLCHPLTLEKVKMQFELIKAKNAVRVSAEVLCSGKTGVEMEALTGASIAALTIYDMCKALSHEIQIDGLRLIEKSGGKRKLVRGQHTS